MGPQIKEMMPDGYPYPEHFGSDQVYCKMKKLDVMRDMDRKLVIQWGQATRSWFQWASNDKEVLSIANREEVEFPGYGELILSYSELKCIVNEDDRYRKWRDALSNVNGVYLICDIKRHKQYVGSTYNYIGFLGLDRLLQQFTATEHGEMIPSEKLIETVYETQPVTELLQVATSWVNNTKYRIDFMYWSKMITN